MIVIPNESVACEPFRSRSATSKQVSKGVFGIEQKLSLIPVKVVYSDYQGRFRSGSTVYLRGDSQKDLWATPLKIGEVEIMVVPISSIVAYEPPAASE